MENSAEELTNHTVIIELKNGGEMKFMASWNHGLSDFINAYENFLRGQAQPKERYSFRTVDHSQTNNYVGKFENIVAIHLSSNRN